MSTRPDPQQNQLYEWERAFVETRVPAEAMSTDEVVLLIARVSGTLGIPTPRVRFLSLNVSCRAVIHENVLEVAPWGRTRATLLHEMAHLGSWPAILRGDSPHGRAFTTLAIILYNRFLGLPLDYLVDTAQSRRLDLDPVAARSPIGNEVQPDFADNF